MFIGLFFRWILAMYSLMPLLENCVLVADDIILMQSFSSRRFANLLLSSVIKMIQGQWNSLGNLWETLSHIWHTNLEWGVFFKGGEGVEDI